MNGQSVTLEPGGQFELSGAPLENLHQTCAEVNSHLYQVRTHPCRRAVCLLHSVYDQVKTIAEQIDAAFLGIGYDPKSSLEQVPIMPKNRWTVNGCRDIVQLNSVFVRRLSSDTN